MHQTRANLIANMYFFKYIFYRIFSFYRKKHDEAESAITSMIFVSLFMFMNIFVVSGLLYNFKLLPVFFDSKIQVVIFMIALFGINYFILLYKKKYSLIISEVEKKPQSKGKLKGWLIVLYFLISCFLLFIIPFVKL